MVTRKTSNKVVLKEEKVPEEPKAEPVVNKKPAATSRKNEEIKKIAPIMANLDVLTYMIIKNILLKVLARLGVKIPTKDVFKMLGEVGKLVKLEPYELGKGAEYTKDYLKRILEKVNGK